jgi:two-component system KDP operon response regulator KdpE
MTNSAARHADTVHETHFGGSPSAGRLLLVDDEPQILRALTPALAAEGYEVTTAEGGEAAVSFMASEGCDVVLLDLGLPDMDGKTVIDRIRQWSDTPIVVLSARDIVGEKISALDRGADDFLNKPFEIGELLARLRASLRGRDKRVSVQASLHWGDLKLDFAARRVFIQGDEVKLSPKEYELVRTLARYAGKVVTHRQLITAVWGPGSEVETQLVRVLVAQVRQKLEEEPSRPRYILTEPGLGYRLGMGDKPAAGRH